MSDCIKLTKGLEVGRGGRLRGKYWGRDGEIRSGKLTGNDCAGKGIGLGGEGVFQRWNLSYQIFIVVFLT